MKVTKVLLKQNSYYVKKYGGLELITMSKQWFKIIMRASYYLISLAHRLWICPNYQMDREKKSAIDLCGPYANEDYLLVVIDYYSCFPEVEIIYYSGYWLLFLFSRSGDYLLVVIGYYSCFPEVEIIY